MRGRQKGRVGIAGLITGFGVWALAFVALYGVHGFACASGWNSDTARLVMGGVWLAALVAVLLFMRLLIRARDSGKPFPRTAGLTLAIGAVVATIWLGVPVLVLPTC